MITYREYLNESSASTIAYAKAVGLDWRIPEVEEILLKEKDVYHLYLYAKNVIHDRWSVAEPLILTDINYAYDYLCDVIKKPWLEAEPVFKKHPTFAKNYAIYFLKSRWPEAEPYIRHFQADWKEYVKYLVEYKNLDYYKTPWLKAGITDELVEILNKMGINQKQQEYICQHRPDLINKIKYLDPALARKYQHEQDLGKVDL